MTSGALLLAQLAPGDYSGQFGCRASRLPRSAIASDSIGPFAEQYTGWLQTHARRSTSASRSSTSGRSSDLVRERPANTAILALAALVVATLLGIPGGIFTGSRRGGWPPRLICAALSLVLLSVPPLISSLVLLTIAARTGWLPVSGMGGPSATWSCRRSRSRCRSRRCSSGCRRSRSATRSAGRPPWRPAPAAFPSARIVWRHGWRQSLGPILAIYGVIIGSLFSGSFAVEIVTSWPGLGDLMRQALMARDTYLVAGCAAAGAAFLAAGVLAADVAHALADPRIEGAPGA